jgi:predicted dehydrogenase
MRPLKVGVIGCGVAACDLHLPALRRIDEAEVVALADPSPAALDGAGERFGVDRRAGDYRELLADGSIDAVCAAVPAHLHTEVALEALDAGKHVLIEKPLALSLDDCDLLVERAAASGLKAMVAFNQRWHRHARRARELVRLGRLGEVKLLRSAYTTSSVLRIAGRRWRMEASKGGGMLAIQAVHHLDLWRFLLADGPVEVFCGASGVQGGAAEGQAATIVASTPAGVRIASEFCAVTGLQNEFAIYGSEAWLRASLYRFDSFELMPREESDGDLARRARAPGRFLAELARAAPSIRRGRDFDGSYEAQWRHFLDAIRRDSPVECGLEEGREVTRTLLAVLKSAETGTSVRLADAPRAIGDLPSIRDGSQRAQAGA